MLNVDLKKFTKNHKRNINQVIYCSIKTNGFLYFSMQAIANGCLASLVLGPGLGWWPGVTFSFTLWSQPPQEPTHIKSYQIRDQSIKKYRFHFSNTLLCFTQESFIQSYLDQYLQGLTIYNYS